MKYKLKELLTIHNGKDYRQQHKGIIPVYGTGGVMTHIDAYLYTGESILLPRKGSLSNIMYVNGPFWTVDTIYWTTVNTHLVNAKYLYYYLSLLDLSSRDTGSALPSMTYNSYYELDIDLPSLSVQQKIAQSIDNIDQKIAINNTISKELESMAKTIYDYWFLQFEFPNESGEPYKSSDGEMIWNDILKKKIPEGWEVKKLQDLVKLGNGINYSKDTSGDNLYKIVNVRDITSSSLLINDRSLTKISLPNTNIDKYLVNNNDILIARSGTPGAVRILTSTSEQILFAGFIIHCLPNNPALRWYLMYSLKKLEGTNATTTGGSILQNVSQTTLKSISIILPTTPIIEKFNQQITPIVEQLENLLKESQQLKSLRNFLLPMLMNGQVTIKD